MSAQSGRAMRMPTEVEWEAAARGRGGRQYAWGDDFKATRCNTFEAHVRSTTPIGVFPGGDTTEGLIDMTGNVWAWTSSVYKAYPYDAADGREDAADSAVGRVVRGGSWDGSRGGALAAYRLNGAPDSRNGSVGFRLVCVSPIR